MRLALHIVPFVILSALVAPFRADGVPVSREDAADAACGFVRRGRFPGTRLGVWVQDISELAATNGTRFFAVRMFGGGTVFTAGDTAAEPIIAFTSATNDFSRLDPASPLAALLNRDAERRLPARPLVGRSTTAAQWQALIDAAPATAASGSGGSLTAISDTRVAPLVQSQWNQDTTGGLACYNYYTPYSATRDDPGNSGNAVCGCVATAMSQVMRYHEFPRAAVEPVTHDCWFGKTRLPRTTAGGAYDWTSMTLRPDTDGTTLTNRQAIGRLTSDAGIAIYMQYTSRSSGAYSDLVPQTLTDVFGYAQALDLAADNGRTSIVSERVYERTILANLDAGLPVILGISDNYNNGHSIVGDGYGYESGLLYVHLNMGWSGQGDIWYNLPNIVSTYTFRFVDVISYNIQPERSGALLTGRVVDANTNALAGAQVAVYAQGSDTPLTNLVTSASGVYAAVLPASIYRVTATTDTPRRTGTISSVTLSEASTYDVTYAFPNPDGTSDAHTFSTVQSESSTGNSWGNDITLYEASVNLNVAATDGQILTTEISPGPGIHTYERGSSVTLTAPALALSVANDFGVSCFKYACLGWTDGTGGVPPSGTTNTVTVTLTGDATIRWVYGATPAKALQRTFLSTFDYALLNTNDYYFYSTTQREELWRDYGTTVSYALPQEAVESDPYPYTGYYWRPGDRHYRYGTLDLRLCGVELSTPGEEGEICYDAARHYAMPTNASFVADHGQDVCFYYLPEDDMWSPKIPTWWFYRTLMGPWVNELITEDETADDADPDGDGSSNQREYRRGTDPMDPESVIRYPNMLLFR